MDTKNKSNIKLLSFVASVMLLIIVVGASFAYFGTYKEDIDKYKINITIDEFAKATFVTKDANLNLVVSKKDMVAYEAGTKAAENSANLNVVLTSGNPNVKVTCTYDIYYEYDTNSSIYGVSPTTVTNNSLKELTLKAVGSSGTNNYADEKNFNYDSSWTTNPYKKLIVKGASITDATKNGTTDTWNFNMAFYNLDADQNNLAGKTFAGTFYVDKDSIKCNYEENKLTLYQTIEQRYNEDKTYLGLYTGEESENYKNKVYYYKDNVQDNNVLFAGFCWKIVRTTETGGVKLIYNGTQTGGSCNNTGTDSQIGTSSFNSSYKSPAYVGYMYNNAYEYSIKSMSSQSNIVFGSSFTYANGSYSLTGTKTVATWSSGYNTLNSNHYTCLSTGTICTSLYYVYYTSSGYAYYITLTGGKSVDDALNEMLYNANTKSSNSSTIKTYIDNWYKNNMASYTDKLEDTVFCNDRSMSNKTNNGWYPNGGSTSTSLYFKYNNIPSTPSLKCTNENDKFTVDSSNGNGALTYPVGLLTVPEAKLANYSSSNYLNNGQYVWLASPDYFYSLSAIVGMAYSAGLTYGSVNNSWGVRPSVSLKPGTSISSGDGSYTSPFVIE